jgi:hypothetical protein
MPRILRVPIGKSAQAARTHISGAESGAFFIGLELHISATPKLRQIAWPLLRRSTNGAGKRGMGKVRPASGLSSTSHHFPFIHHSFPLNVCATHCRLTSPTPCYGPPYHFPIHQTNFPSAVDHLPYVPGYQLLSPVFLCPVLPLPFTTSNDIDFFAICYAFLATSHGHAFVLTNNVSRLNEHYYQPVFLPVHKPPVQSNKRTAPGQHVTRLERADLLARLCNDRLGLVHAAQYSQ